MSRILAFLLAVLIPLAASAQTTTGRRKVSDFRINNQSGAPEVLFGNAGGQWRELATENANADLALTPLEFDIRDYRGSGATLEVQLGDSATWIPWATLTPYVVGQAGGGGGSGTVTSVTVGSGLPQSVVVSIPVAAAGTEGVIDLDNVAASPLSAGYAAAAGAVAPGDSLEAALQKLDGNIAGATGPSTDANNILANGTDGKLLLPLDSAGFSGNLTAADDTLQELANALDGLAAGTNLLTGDQTQTAARTHAFADFGQTWNNLSSFTINQELTAIPGAFGSTAWNLNQFDVNSTGAPGVGGQLLLSPGDGVRLNHISGTESSGINQIGAVADDLRLYSATTSGAGSNATVEVDASSHASMVYNDGLNATGVRAEANSVRVLDATVAAGTAANGEVLTLVDAATGRVEFAASGGDVIGKVYRGTESAGSAPANSILNWKAVATTNAAPTVAFTPGVGTVTVTVTNGILLTADMYLKPSDGLTAVGSTVVTFDDGAGTQFTGDAQTAMPSHVQPIQDPQFNGVLIFNGSVTVQTGPTASGYDSYNVGALVAGGDYRIIFGF